LHIWCKNIGQAVQIYIALAERFAMVRYEKEPSFMTADLPQEVDRFGNHIVCIGNTVVVGVD